MTLVTCRACPYHDLCWAAVSRRNTVEQHLEDGTSLFSTTHLSPRQQQQWVSRWACRSLLSLQTEPCVKRSVMAENAWPYCQIDFIWLNLSALCRPVAAADRNTTSIHHSNHVSSLLPHFVLHSSFSKLSAELGLLFIYSEDKCLFLTLAKWMLMGLPCPSFR